MPEEIIVPEEQEEEYTVQMLNSELEQAVQHLEEAIFIANRLDEKDLLELITTYELDDVLNELQEITNKSEGFTDDDD